MSSPITTPTEARITHAVGLVVGIGIAVAGFLANHKGVQLPCTSLTVGGLIAAVSHWRFLRIIETTVESAVTWERDNRAIVATLKENLTPLARQLAPSLPFNLKQRLIDLEDAVVHAAPAAAVDEEAIANRVLAKLAAVATAPPAPKPTATNGPVPVQGSGNSAPAPAPVPDVAGQDVATPPASTFQDPPVVAQQ